MRGIRELYIELNHLNTNIQVKIQTNVTKGNILEGAS